MLRLPPTTRPTGKPTPITSLEKTLKRLPPVERAIKAVKDADARPDGQPWLFDALVVGGGRRRPAAVTEVMGAIHQTTGPVVSRQLLTDVAGWLADPGGCGWRDCWRPVLDAVGIESPNPTCLQCGHQTLAVTPLHLCGRLQHSWECVRIRAHSASQLTSDRLTGQPPQREIRSCT